MKSKISAVFIICGLILFCSGAMLGQQDRYNDSLKTLLKKTTKDSAKAELLNKLCFGLSYINLDQAFDYGKQAIILSEKIAYKKEQCMAYNNMGIVYDQKGEGDSALLYYNKCLDMSKKIKNIYLEASALSNLGYIYWSQGNYDKALDQSLKALAIIDTGRNYSATAGTIEHIAMIYYDLKDYKNSIKHHRQAIAIYKIAKDESNIAMAYCNMALNYVGPDKDSMIYFLKKGEVIFQKEQNHWALGHVYNNLGGIYIETKKPDPALAYLFKARNEHAIVGDDRGMCATQVSLGMSWLMKDKPAIAKNHLDTAISMATKMEMNEELSKAYRNYALMYSRLGILDSVTKYLDLEDEIKDSIFSGEKTKTIAEMQTRYDTEKKDLEISKQKIELVAQENAKKRRETLIFALVGLVLLIIVLGYFIYSRNKIKQKAKMDKELANQRDIRSKAVIEAEEKERRRIAQDLHDGVGQILSAAKLNLSGLEDKLKLEKPEQSLLLSNALELVNDSVKEVRSVSHNMMPNTLIKLGLASAVREFITKIASVPNLRIDLQIVGMEERLENTVETVLYRVIQEVVANIIKHAKANEISMQLIRHDNELTIMIEDNGVGFDKTNITKFEGIGLKNIISRIEFLNGNVDFDSTPGQGTTVVIEIPIVPTS